MPRRDIASGRRRIGLVSDTHGRLDSRVPAALAGVERIIHAGDVGHPHVLWELELIAPVVAVAGNVDHTAPSTENLPDVQRLEVDGTRISVVHVRDELPARTMRESDVIIYGHSHLPLVEKRDGVLWVNPGSASQARRSPIGRSVAVLDLGGEGGPQARVLPLSDYGAQQ